MVTALDLSSLKSRLSREGAQSGAITASLIWNDPSDLDLYAYIKRNGQNHEDCIFYGHKKAAGGYLDVDMNVRETGKGFSLEPVENIFWKTPPGGTYRIVVKNAGTKTSDTKWGGHYSHPKRDIEFKVFLNKDDEMQEFAGTWKGDGSTPQIEAFTFDIEGSGDIPGTGGGGNFIVFPPESVKSTFKELCAKYDVPFAMGSGYYAVARKEKIQAGKEMLLQHLETDNFTIGGKKCRDALDWPAGEVNKGPGDILAGHRLFVQSTSANRVIPPGTHVLFEVDDAVYAKYRKTHHIEAESHTSGTAGMSAAAKAEAKAAAKGKAKAKAAPKPEDDEEEAEDEDAEGEEDDAEAEEEEGEDQEDDDGDIPIAEQHAFLDLAKDNKWAEVKRKVNAKPSIVGVTPAQRWSALHQAAASGDADMVKFLLDKGASIDVKNKDGETPLDVAADDKTKAILKDSTKRGTKRKAQDEPAPKAKGKAKAEAKAKPKVEPKVKAKAKAKAKASLAGKKIVFTGTLSTKRAEATAAAKKAGATVLNDVSGNMDILIAGPGAGAKMSKAEGLGKEVWDEDKFKAAVGL
eukprot:TRINITY_DN61214_c0_g1_i1.p1 TRINITY_DN61214_c0_g1~~TRINITY_DN61214_c0_g1_i1.p1  ORF type:complete len:585 (-),score=153.33 TRINITY_DN61214_c0_g1_i1:60-1784(-)